MRAALVVVFVAVVMAFAPSSSADVFPDLPGVGMLEEVTTGKAPELGTTTSGSFSPDASVPAPNSAPSVSSVTKDVTPDQVEVVVSLPGGGGLPILKDVAAAGATSSNMAPLIAFAAMFCIAFTRWLYRLNELGSRPV